MTCIVGVETPSGGVIIGGDAMLSSPWTGWPLKYPKVFQSGEILYGYCGSLRAGQILQYSFSPPQLPDEDTDEAIEKYLVSEWVTGWRETLASEGSMKVKHEHREYTDGSSIMIGVRGRIYLLQDDFAIWRSAHPYQAMGSGEEFALGVLHTLESSQMAPKRKVEAALRAAAEFATTVAGPFTILEIEGE